MSSLVKELLDSYASGDGIVEITLPKGETIKFKMPSSFGGWARMQTEASNWWKGIRNSMGAMPQWKEFDDLDEADGKAAYIISKLSHDPKIDERSALALTRNAFLTQHILVNLDASGYLKSVTDQQKEAERLGESSESTAGDETDSE